MSKRTNRPAGLVGASGLTAAVISQAIIDALGDDREWMLDAWAYLGGDWYKFHVDSLGIKPDTWPEALIRMDDDEYMRITDRIIRSCTT